MLRSGLINMIREKAQEGKSPYAISKETGISENTIKKYISPENIAAGIPPHGLKGRHKGSKLDPFKADIDEMLSRGIYNCEVIQERLKEKGYAGKITILKEYVSPHRPPKSAPAVQRYSTLPGKQAQMDWGIVNCIDADGVIHKIPGFVMIMGSSRAKYVEFTKRCDFYSLIRCMVDAFEYFGGVPDTVLTDNMKTVIHGREAGKPLWNSQFENFAADMGFIPKVCKPRRPRTKGKVERLVRYVKENFLPGCVFTDLNDLNTQVIAWCKKVDSRKHSTTGKIPLIELGKEPLHPLPAAEVLLKYRWESRRVTKDGMVSYDGVLYGVPWQYSGRNVRVRLLRRKVEIYDGEVRIAEHPLEASSGTIILRPGQYKGLTEAHGIVVAAPFARQEWDSPVEVRPLNIYDLAVGVASNG